MNVKNLEFLKETLKYMGFGDKLNADLEKNIQSQPAEFKLAMPGEFAKGDTKERVDFTLDFKKSTQTDMYFFNRYQATLKNDDPALEKSQIFYITKNAGITAKEAYNLLSGRAVKKDLENKEGQAFNAWVQLDFAEKDKHDNFKVKQYHEGYGFRLEEVLQRYPIRELTSDDDKTKLMKSLEKGNIQQVTFDKEGVEEKVYISANPQYKSLDIYDSKMEKQYHGIARKENREPDQSKDKKETIKQDPDEESEGKRKSKKRGIGV